MSYRDVDGNTVDGNGRAIPNPPEWPWKCQRCGKNLPAEYDSKVCMACEPAARISALEAENARLREALKEVTRCDTCEGEKQITLECDACLSGDWCRCECSKNEPMTCPQCNGEGRYYRGSALAKEVFDAARGRQG